MTLELPQEVADRLKADHHGWLTTVAQSGQPVPRLVWFYFDGADLTVYTMPKAAKVSHVRAHPPVSLNLDSDGNGAGIIVIGGTATVDAEGVDCRDDRPFWDKYKDDVVAFGLTDVIGDYSTRIRITPTRVWTTPTG